MARGDGMGARANSGVAHLIKENGDGTPMLAFAPYGIRSNKLINASRALSIAMSKPNDRLRKMLVDPSQKLGVHFSGPHLQ
jgi:hypothetical protein